MRDDLAGYSHNPSPPDPDERPDRLYIYKSLNQMELLLEAIADQYWAYEDAVLFDKEMDVINEIQAAIDKLRGLVEGGKREHYQ